MVEARPYNSDIRINQQVDKLKQQLISNSSNSNNNKY